MAYDPSEGLINGANLVGGLLTHGRDTQDYVTGMFDLAARRKAGVAAAAGDYSGAQAVLGERGMLAPAETMRALGTTRTALKAAATGDYSGALDAAATGGDTELFGQVQGAEAKEKADRAAWLGHAADALLQIKDPTQREAAFKSSVAPTLKAMGVKDDQIATISGQSLTDEGLLAFKTTLGHVSKMEIRQDPNTGEILGVDPATGETKVLHSSPRKPEWKEVKHKDADGNETTTWIDLNAAPDGGGDTPAATPEPKGATYEKVAAVATAAGAKPDEVRYLKRLAQIESSGDPSAKNGKSTGLFQFHADTFAGVGGGDINSVEDQTKAALALQSRDRRLLQSKSVDASDANTYIMHQQGPAGGLALLTAPPEIGAVAALTPVYGDAKTARKAIVNNGGTADMSAGDFVSMWQRKWGGGSAAAGPHGIPGSTEEAQNADELSDRAIELAAERYNTNGVLPTNTGRNGKAIRHILDKAAEMEDVTGRTGAEAVAAWAGVKANTATLGKLTQTRGMVKSFEDNAVANADLALSLAPKGAAPLNVPVINRWVQTGRRAVAGDPNVTQFDIALGTFLDEYAKITSGATGSQGSTDASRREAYDRLSKYATKGQLAAGVATMKQEMGNRIVGLDQQIAATTAAIGGGHGAPKPAAAVAPRPDGWSKLLPKAQLTTAMKFNGATGPGGTEANPLIPTSQAQFDHMQPGQWFINPADGKVMQKKR
jgi:hypothetical protein